jgi:hypothetical protein
VASVAGSYFGTATPGSDFCPTAAGANVRTSATAARIRIMLCEVFMIYLLLNVKAELATL